MILEIVRGFMGAGIITDSGIKMPIGNMVFNVGDPVYTDGEYAFGHSPERGKFINFIDNIPMIEVFLTFEQEKTLDWNTFKYTCNKRTVKIHSIDFDNDFEILDEVVADGDFKAYVEDSSYTDFLYSSSKIFIVENYWYNWYKLKVMEYGNDISEFKINSDEGEVFNCTDLYVDDNENFNAATCAASSNINERVSVAVIKHYINSNENIVKDYSSDVDDLIMSRYNQLNSVLPNVIKVISGTRFVITELRSIDSNGNPIWEDVTSTVEFINHGTLDVLETKKSTRFPGLGNFVPQCADVWGGSFVKGVSQIEINKKITSFRMNTNSNIGFNGCVFTWDTTLNRYETYKDGKNFYITKYAYNYNTSRPYMFGFNIFGKVSAIVGENIKKIYYDDSKFKFDYNNLYQEKHDEIFLNEINNISNVNETNLEIKFKLKDSGWFLVGYIKDENYHIGDCYLTDNNIKIDCNTDFNTPKYLCDVMDCGNYILFKLTDEYNTVIYYNKTTGETKRKTVDDYNFKLSKKIKININDYKKLLATLLAK